MALNPIEFNGVIQRSGDMSVFKQNEDAKSTVNQQNIQSAIIQHEDETSNRVNDVEESDFFGFRYDAKDGGSNGTYQYHGKKKKKNEEEKDNKDGRVIKKTEGGNFDITI
ncbi:MAG: hypothetical protein K6E13_04250 [Lachnospiraceae bacterium]|nr:hypothetical protein [Lachnospiraceae bacterium]